MAAQICETCKKKGSRCYCAPNSTCEAYEREFGETKKEKITQIIYDYLDRVYCDNCRYNSELETDKYGDDPCEDCIRKSMGWEISLSMSEQIAEDILKIEDKEKSYFPNLASPLWSNIICPKCGWGNVYCTTTLMYGPGNKTTYHCSNCGHSWEV